MCVQLFTGSLDTQRAGKGAKLSYSQHQGCLLCDLSGPCPLPALALDTCLGHPGGCSQLRQSHGHCVEPAGALKCCWLQLGGLSTTPLPVGCHLQAEASLHLHELLVVPQPVGHSQGEGCLLILQVGDLSLKRTEGLGVRGLELCGVQLSSSGHRKR